jgi:peptide/nickel transport system permease protein
MTSAQLRYTTQRWSEASNAAFRQFLANRAGVFGAVLLIVAVGLAVCAPLIAPSSDLNPAAINNPLNAPPSWHMLLGTDPQGRSVAVSLLWGARSSLLVGFVSAALSMLLGTVIGLMAAHYGGVFSGVLMRLIDFFLVVPSLVLAIVLASVIGRSLTTIIVAISVTSWAGTARVVRAQALSIEGRPYVERAWVLGASHGHVLFKQVLPGVMPIVMAGTTLQIGDAIITASTLAFLGISDPSQSSWGAMLELALSSGAASAGYWWFVLAPGIAIVLVVMAFTLVGRALETVVNPTLLGR